ncbi:MAG: RNA polymerase sigma factor [Phenylobacterium sp.]|uniref:RNA polymerase sigma factor n=1 Tax=Phenylobacterium sp. TaxID=1871053 RepID=UPI0025EF28A2|nr:RNA polymerase sigma factor [Phenylobacterium sp.]MBT9470771.1 RNA polymerase sigma factor [Phenylobacterium sp.]
MNLGEPLSDAALASRAAAGDERAFADLVRRHKEPLYRLLRRYTGNADEAYEAAHEAFIAAWTAIRRYDPQRPFLAWLRTIAINKARDRGRRLAFRRLLFGTERFEDSGALGEPDHAAAADQAVMDRQDLALLDGAIARLPAALKEALLLTAFDGWSQQQAGDILGVSAKTIETRAYRARKILARSLDPALRPKA